MKKIALSPGDPAGIGPEICLKSLQEIKHKDWEEFDKGNSAFNNSSALPCMLQSII